MNQKFTDEQMALILKRAAERQALGGDPTHSLESIQEVARQVGIDPQLIADAAATLGTSSGRSLLGSPSAYRTSRRVTGTPRTIDQAAILATIRDRLPVAGEARKVGDGFEWHSGPADNKTVVAVSPGDGATMVRIDVRQLGPKAIAYLGGGIVGMFAGVISAALWHGPGVAVGAAALGASLAGARGIWNWHADRRDQQMYALADALADQIETTDRAQGRRQVNEGSDV